MRREKERSSLVWLWGELVFDAAEKEASLAFSVAALQYYNFFFFLKKKEIILQL